MATTRYKKTDGAALEGLSNRKKILKVTDALQSRLALRRQLTWRKIRIASQQLLNRARESVKARWVQPIGEIDPQRTNRRPITDPESDGMHHIVEIFGIALPVTK